MTIVFVLWIFTSNYTQPIEVFPTPAICATVAVEVASALDRDPKPFLYRLACIPRAVAGPMPSRGTDL